MQAIKVFRWLCRLTRVSTDCHDQHTKYKPSKLVHSETQRSLHSRTKLISSGFDNLTLQLRSAYPRHQWNQGRSTVKVGHCIDVICVCSESPSLFCYAQVSTLYEASFRVSRFIRGKCLEVVSTFSAIDPYHFSVIQFILSDWFEVLVTGFSFHCRSSTGNVPRILTAWCGTAPRAGGTQHGCQNPASSCGGNVAGVTCNFLFFSSTLETTSWFILHLDTQWILNSIPTHSHHLHYIHRNSIPWG